MASPATTTVSSAAELQPGTSGNATINVASTTGFNTPAATTIASGSNSQSLPQATINVASTTGFPSAGMLTVVTSAGIQQVTYTGTSGGNQFTGCSGGTGTMSTGGAVANPQFIFIMNSAGALQIVWYTSTTSTSFKGCSGGTGTVVANAPVVQAYATTTTAANILPVSTGIITVVSAANLPNAAGLVWIQNPNGTWQAIYYTGSSISPTNEVTGCSGGVGSIPAGATIVLGLHTFGYTTGSQTLAANGTLNVTSTAAFPSKLPLTGSAGSLGLLTTAGYEVVSYTGTTATTFTGCSATVGTLPASGVVVGLFNGYGSGALQTQTIPAVVQSFKDLRALPAPATGTIVEVLGANAPGDGGDGRFIWDANAPGVLNDNVGIVLQSFVASSGAWRREGFLQITSPSPTQYTGASIEVNAKWFGAVGDGITDDTAALTAALKAVNSIAQNLNYLYSPSSAWNPTQVTLVLPSGRYNITSTIELNCYSCLRGIGRAILQTSSTTIPILRTGAAWCDIENITFTGGLHSIALFGPTAFYGGYYSPTAFGNVPCRIDKCNFVYPAGPAIWQDCSPVTTITSGSNGQIFPFSNVTLNVASTSVFLSKVVEGKRTCFVPTH